MSIKNFVSILCLVQTFIFCEIVFAAPIAISSVSDLDFGSKLVANDPAGTVAPGTAENATNGSFRVTGDANRAYTITLPSSAIMYTTGGTQARFRINLSTFRSFPAAGANGRMNAAGEQLLFVGATRAAIRGNQVAGAYSGTYTVTVVY